MRRPAPWEAEQFQSGLPLPTQSRAVPHIHRDDKPLAGSGGYRAFSQIHGIRIDVIVDGGEGLPLNNLIGNSAAIEVGKAAS